MLLEVKKHQAWKLLRLIPGIGPIRAAVLIAVMQTLHRFRTERQLWKYSGLETHDGESIERWTNVDVLRSRPRFAAHPCKGTRT